MSVVAVKITKDKIEIASDSYAGTSTYSQEKIPFVKSFQINGMTFGTVGYGTEISLMRNFAQTHRPSGTREEDITNFFVEFYEWSKKKDGGFKPENTWLFVFRGKVFNIEGLFVRRIKKHNAIGAGMFFAQAVLHLGRSAKEAVKVACELSPYCEAPVCVFTIKR